MWLKNAIIFNAKRLGSVPFKQLILGLSLFRLFESLMSIARALYVILVHFLVVFCKTTTLNLQILRILENLSHSG